MPRFTNEHLIIPAGRTEILPYTSTQRGRSKVVARTGIDRARQGQQVRQQFENAVESFDAGRNGDFVYVVFVSSWGFLLDLDKLDKGDFQLATYKAIQTENESQKIYEAIVRLNKRAISTFLQKVESYIHGSTPTRIRQDGTVGGGNPPNQTLIANIDQIRAATLESFWQEPELVFPDWEEIVWWEVWLIREANDEAENPIALILPVLEEAGIQIGQRFLKFPEHYIYLMRGNANQLSSSLLYTDRLSEIRKPRETADFFSYLERQEQNEWIQNLVNRTDHLVQESRVSVCLLDTGVNITNPLLSNLIPERNLDVVNPEWTKADTHRQGHGTSMAGMVLYGDITDALASNDRIQIYHHLESVKLLENNRPHEPSVYGAITQEAISRGVTLNPDFKRIVCMAVTSTEFEHKGRPSSWSAAIDQSLFGSLEERNDYTLFFVSSGNTPLERRKNYPLDNEDHSIQDPAQSFNAITVGSYTLKDSLDQSRFPGTEPLARRGGMAPCNTTSLMWEGDWCRKPDVVFEGGNQGLQNNDAIDPDSLQLLTTSNGGIGRSWLTLFGDTSASTALAARFAAELYYSYPQLWPETIRALVIHSADWTSAMLQNRPIGSLSRSEKGKLFSTVGYGVPNLSAAKYSANNSLSLIAERTIKPYKFEDSRVQTDQFHLFDLPWPVQALEDLLGTTVKFKITLSYFIEPNPGNKQYEKSASYSSHGLRFKMLDSNESVLAFKKRVSKAMREEDAPYQGEGGEHWILGEKIRNKGSIHKDIWEGSAADLATRNRIAIYPVGGWWRSRKKQHRYDYKVRYSLVVTIETPSESIDVDIYTPVFNQIAISIPSQ